jgi:PhzF family phenazine biosynthesis protein
MPLNHSKNTLDLWQVDVFTRTPLQGNAAAIVFGGENLSTEVMQAIARETNLSETVFVFDTTEDADYSARIFTTRREILFAGHPSLAAAHAVAEVRGGKVLTLKQLCGIGIIELSRDSDLADWFVEMPSPRFSLGKLSRSEAALCLGLKTVDIIDSVAEIVATGVPWLLIELSDPSSLARIIPDFTRIIATSRANSVVGITVYARGLKSGTDAHLRSFAPAEGIFEDPVCGSCAGAVAALLIRNNPTLAYRDLLNFKQGAEISRIGSIQIKPKCSEIDRLAVGGGAITVLRGTININTGRNI